LSRISPGFLTLITRHKVLGIRTTSSPAACTDMKMILLVALTTVCPLYTVALAQVAGVLVESKDRVLTVCDILRDPLGFDGKMIRLRGRLSGTDEGNWLMGAGCPGVLVTDGYVWEPMIFIAAPASRGQIHSVDFAYDFKSEERGRKRYRELLRRLPPSCITWTYVGVFETRKEWSKLMNGNPNGFGHQNAAPGELLTKEVVSVEAITGCHR